MPQDTPSRKLEQYIVRFPDGMRDQLKAAAKANGRSLNAEIIARLEASLRENFAEERQIIDRDRESIRIMMEDIREYRDQLKELRDELGLQSIEKSKKK